jgi:hypothetical protein
VKKILFEVNDTGGEDGEYTTHQIRIDYGYAESDEACDNLALRQVDDEEPVVIQLK